MKKSLIVVVIIIMFSVIAFGVYQYYFGVTNNVQITDWSNKNGINKNDNMAEKIKILVVGVEEQYLKAVRISDNQIGEELCVYFSEDGDIGFKRGQEVLVYFNGDILTSWPAQISNPGKLEIVKQESDIEIPKYVLKNFYSSKNNVNINVTEISNKGISFTIEDKNDVKFDYGNTYALDKQVRNENYTGVGEKIGEDTEYSTSGYTRSRFRILL